MSETIETYEIVVLLIAIAVTVIPYRLYAMVIKRLRYNKSIAKAFEDDTFVMAELIKSRYVRGDRDSFIGHGRFFII